MPKYQCPECEAVLRREIPVEEGKKIKCPKCEVIFKAKAIHDPKDDKEQEKETEKKKAKATEKKVAAIAGDDDEEEGGTYTVMNEADGGDEDARKKGLDFGSLRDKYPKSKRGPAMAKTVRPSSYILFAAALTAVCAIVYLCWGLWPFIFSDEPPRGRAATYRIIHIVSAVISFSCCGLIAHGASKMHTLESYNWAMTASIMAILFCIAPLGLAVGIFGIVTLQDDEVKEGFEETAVKQHDY